MRQIPSSSTGKYGGISSIFFQKFKMAPNKRVNLELSFKSQPSHQTAIKNCQSKGSIWQAKPDKSVLSFKKLLFIGKN